MIGTMKIMRKTDLGKLKIVIKCHSKIYDTPEKCRNYLIYTLRTHNPDGTLTKEYGGEYTTPIDEKDED